MSNHMNLNIRFRSETFPLVVPSDANLDQLHTAMLAYQQQQQQQRNSTSSTTTDSYRFLTSCGDEIIRSSATNLRSYGINNDSIIIAESVNNTSPVDMILTSEVPNVSHTSLSTLSCAVSLRAPKQMEQESKRVPIDLVMVIDRSGSMSDIMPLVKTTLEFMVSQLMSEDRLCLITYDDRIETIFPLTKMSTDAKQLAQSRIAGIAARGGTDLASGLFHGLHAVLSRALENRNQVASVLLFTDGQANQGITDQATIIDRIKDISFLLKGAFDKQGPQQVPQHRQQYHPYQRQQQQLPQPPPQQYQQQPQQLLPPAYQQLPPPSYQQATMSVDNDSKTSSSSSSSTSSQATPTSLGCTINTFGFGSQHNASLLKCIAECGNGLYFYMENNEQIGTSFVECIGGLLSTVVQDINITLNVQEGVQFVKVHSGAYQQTSSANGKQIVVRIPDLRSEEERDILCTVQLSSQTEPVSSQPILSSHLAYYDLVSNSYTTTSSQLCVARVAPSDPVLSSQTSSVLISKQLSRIDATDALEDAKKQAANGQLASAREQLTAAIAQVTKRSDGSEYYKQLLQSLQEALNGMVSQQQYQQQGKQYIEAAWSGHAQQRSNVQAPMYQNQNQAQMQTAYNAYKSR